MSKPILFNTEMVRAILEGRKTQTRRLCKGQPQDGVTSPEKIGYKPPYNPGDVLYVRETFCGYYLPSVERWPEGHMHYEYKASNPNGNKRPMGPEFDDDWEVRAWRPSIHMPKEAARIFLKVKDVRAERLQDISVDEIRAEGLDVLGKTMNTSFKMWSELWNSTVKKADLQRYGWEANPWVWVIEFEKMERKPDE